MGRTVIKVAQFSSVTQSCPTPCDPMDCSTPGFPVHHQLPEFSSYRGCWKQSTDRRTDLSCRPLGPVHVFLEVGLVPGLGVWLGLRLASTRWPLPG